MSGRTTRIPASKCNSCLIKPSASRNQEESNKNGQLIDKFHSLKDQVIPQDEIAKLSAHVGEGEASQQDISGGCGRLEEDIRP